MSEVILSQVDQETSDKPKRKTIGDKLRFEVFKRDNFKCQYCGMSAPDVVLNVDHIDPVSNGGENDILNLVTSCRDCNSGKSDRLLSEHSMLDKQRKMLEDLEERRQQLKMMIQWREQLSNFDEEQASALAKIINEILSYDATSMYNNIEESGDGEASFDSAFVCSLRDINETTETIFAEALENRCRLLGETGIEYISQYIYVTENIIENYFSEDQIKEIQKYQKNINDLSYLTNNEK